MSSIARLFCLGLAVLSTVMADQAHAQVVLAQDEARQLLEANKVLQEEIKLAVRPQPYVFLDLTQRIVFIKARGVELHRLLLLEWQVTSGPLPIGAYRLTTRPSVSRPQAKPGEDATEHPIELADMPVAYQVLCDPPLLLSVIPPIRDHPGAWLAGIIHEWWLRSLSWVRTVLTAAPPRASLRLTLSKESAQSLAWTATDGMPIVIGPAAVSK
jgi:hypothetical protein